MGYSRKVEWWGVRLAALAVFLWALCFFLSHDVAWGQSFSGNASKAYVVDGQYGKVSLPFRGAFATGASETGELSQGGSIRQYFIQEYALLDDRLSNDGGPFTGGLSATAKEGATDYYPISDNSQQMLEGGKHFASESRNQAWRHGGDFLAEASPGKNATLPSEEFLPERRREGRGDDIRVESRGGRRVEGQEGSQEDIWEDTREEIQEGTWEEIQEEIQEEIREETRKETQKEIQRKGQGQMHDSQWATGFSFVSPFGSAVDNEPTTLSDEPRRNMDDNATAHPGFEGAMEAVPTADDGLAKSDSFGADDTSRERVVPPEASATSIEAMLAGMSLHQKIGQLLMVGFRGIGDVADDSMGRILQAIEQGAVGGIILFDYDVTMQSPVRNIVSLEQVGRLTNRLQRKAPIPLFIGVDQEGGRVVRLKSIHGMPDLPSPKFLGAGPLDATYEAYDTTAEHLANVGINVDFAPGVDVDIDPLSPAIGRLERSYSAYPDIVVSHAGAFAEALEKQGIMPTFKHFPGHGSAATDTHLGLADITQTWEQEELVPYTTLLPKHPRAMVMVGHVFHRFFDDSYPASLSKNIITGLLRQELGWDGLVITDDLDMQAISDYYSLKECVGLALNAGVDILLFGNNLQYDPNLGDKLFQSVLDLVEDGEVSEERIDEACGRVLRAKSALYPSFFGGEI